MPVLLRGRANRPIITGLAAGAALLAGVFWLLSARTSPAVGRERVTLRGPDRLTVALTGDTVLGRPLPRAGDDAGFSGVVNVLNAATVAATNLDQSALAAVPPPGRPSWPYASLEAIHDLRRSGIGVVSCANNHALDYGVAGLQDTRRLLEDAGLVAVGCGEDLAQARAAASVEDPSRRVTFIGVAVSAAPEARATASRGDISGRPGVSALRYTANVTADPFTFATLKSVAALRAGSVPPGSELRWEGAVVREGPETSVEMEIDEEDAADVLRRIADARSNADAVVVTLHSHEPGNRSERPAEFVQKFARRAIDAGADIVVGHGPHRLRGVEAYGRGAIFYSVGDFVFDYDAVDFATADVYEAGLDLYQEMLGARGTDGIAPPRRDEEAIWWEGVIVLAAFEGRSLASVRLLPLDLGAGLPRAARGTPRLAEGAVARATLERLARLSADLGTRVRLEDGVGVLDLDQTPGAGEEQ